VIGNEVTVACAWTVRGEAPFWLSGASGAAADELTWESLPAISCQATART
jgi:hypothetical protein